MGRIWDFLNQDANAALDRLLKPYVEFILSHPLWMYVVYAAGIAAVWIFVSKTLALLGIAVVLLSIVLSVVLTIFGRAAAMWRRRGR